jgi:membrane peptidoglycan carboxypeptidase
MSSTPPRRSVRGGAAAPSGAGAPWSATGAAAPPRQPVAGGGGAAGGSGGRRGGGGGGGGRGSGGGSGSGGGTGGGAPARRRRLIDYPRYGKTGWRRWIPSWKLIFGLFLLGLALLVGVAVWAYASTDIPDPDEFAQSQTTTVLYADGETVMGTFGEANREIVSGEAIPQHVKDAVVAAEDRTFYENAGISPTGMARALWNNLRGNARQGGSTITQQYAERYYFGTTVDDYRGKAREAILAVKLDQSQDKDQILENYLNTIFFGRGAYGVERAAQEYFGVPVSELDVSQAALIAGIIPSPNNWDPRNDPERAEQRWNYVLDGMVQIDRLTQAERDALTFPETIEYVRDDRYAGPRGYLLDMVRREVLDRSPVTEQELETRGYRIVSTIEVPMQESIELAATSVPEDRPANLRVSMVSLDPADGAIKALYGGPDFITQTRNGVTQDIAQAGSTFKPFTLVAYLENGGSLRSRYNGDSGLTIDGFPNPVPNFGQVDFGDTDLLRATAQSVNTVYAQMNVEPGVEEGPARTVDVAVRAGVNENAVDLQPPVPSNVLGTPSVNPLDMAESYNTFAAQGVHNEPFIVRSMEYLDGGTVYQGAGQSNRVFAEDVMADTTFALQQVVERGSGEPAQAIGRPSAGKTGTSNENRSAWYVGYTPQLTTAVALYQVSEDGRSAEPITPFGGYQEITGGTVPVRVWTDHMARALEGTEVIPFPARADIGEPNVPPIVAIPSVVGLPEAEAVAQLRAAGFGAAVTRSTDPSVAEGLVISQSPSGEAEQGSTVTIVVSEGTGLVGVPNVVGQNVEQARATLAAAGFSVAARDVEAEAPPGQVVGQNPGGGQAQPGSTVSIDVSTGPPPPPEPTPPPAEPAPPGQTPAPPTEPVPPPGEGNAGGGASGTLPPGLVRP